MSANSGHVPQVSSAIPVVKTPKTSQQVIDKFADSRCGLQQMSQKLAELGLKLFRAFGQGLESSELLFDS